ncbi:MAG: lysophospholipid acyltransferase family protein [Gemmatimonadaceae bacterium]
MTVAGITPEPITHALARCIGAASYNLLGERRRILLGNLRRTAPTASAAERRRLARNTFRYIAESQADLLRLPSRPPNEILGLMDMAGMEHLDAALALGRGAIVVTGHISNYELGGACLAARGYPVHAMVEDVRAELLDVLRRYRTATGMHIISRNRGKRDAYRVLTSGGVLVLVADRVIGKDAQGQVVPFGNGRRAVPQGPATLSLATGAPIVVGSVTRTRTGRTRYLATFEPPLMPDKTEADAASELTRRVAERLAAAVRAHPDQWFVFQPEWVSAVSPQSVGEPA